MLIISFTHLSSMGRFYFDTEFTNGNYYLGDIIDIALHAEESGNTFHSYVQIHYLIPTRVKELTSISDDLLASVGCKFKDAMVSFLDFIQREQKESSTAPVIIAHGGYQSDFPLLLANCMKRGVLDYGILPNCSFVDSVEVFKSCGYTSPGLDSLCIEFGLVRHNHSALSDVKLLCNVFEKHLCKYNINYNCQFHTFADLMFYLKQRLPVPIQKIYSWAWKCQSKQELEITLSKFVKKKTALNANQVLKISHWYFKDRHFMKKCI